MYVVIYLDQFNMSTILIEFGKPGNYHGSEMYFLKCPIRYAFEEPVDIQRSSFGFKLLNIPKKDRDILNTLFWRMNRNLFIKDSSYINYNENKEEFLEKGDKQKIHIQILGYKKSANGVLSPIWKILHDKYY